MEEKVLLSAKQYSAKRIIVGVILIGLALLIVSILYEPVRAFCSGFAEYNYHCKHDTRFCDGFFGWECCRDYAYKTESALQWGIEKFAYKINFVLFNESYGHDYWAWGRIAFALSFPIAILVYFALRRYEMVVTNKRVYGRVIFGKRVDIPNDSISAVSTISIIKGVAVASSSGRISFLLIKNANEIYDEINRILIERQNETAKPIEAKQEALQSNADELKKYKELLDGGIITQEEFDAKKKQLLGL